MSDKWEYYVWPNLHLMTDSQLSARLEELGNQGWELVLKTSSQNMNPALVFKRKKESWRSA